MIRITFWASHSHCSHHEIMRERIVQEIAWVFFFSCVSVGGNTPEKKFDRLVCLKDSFVATHQPAFKTLLSKRLYYIRSEERSRLLPDLKSLLTPLSKTVHQCCSEVYRCRCTPLIRVCSWLKSVPYKHMMDVKLATFFGPIAVIIGTYMKDMHTRESPAVSLALYKYKEVKGRMQKALIKPIHFIESSLFERYSVMTLLKAFLKMPLNRQWSFKVLLVCRSHLNQCSRFRILNGSYASALTLLASLLTNIYRHTFSIYTAPLLNMILIKRNTLKSGSIIDHHLKFHVLLFHFMQRTSDSKSMLILLLRDHFTTNNMSTLKYRSKCMVTPEGQIILIPIKHPSRLQLHS